MVMANPNPNGNGNGTIPPAPADPNWQQSFTEANAVAPVQQAPPQIQNSGYVPVQEPQQPVMQQPVMQQPPTQPVMPTQPAPGAPGSGQWLAYPEDVAKGEPGPMGEQPTPQMPPQGFAPPQEPQLSALAQQAQELGIDLSGTNNDAEVYARMAGKVEELQSQQQHMLAAQQQQQYQQQPQPQHQPQITPQETEEEFVIDNHFSKVWNLPDKDPSWEQMAQSGVIIQDPNTGMFVPAEAHEYLASSPALHSLNQYQTSQRAVERTKQLWDAYQQPIERMIQDKFETMWDDRHGAEKNQQFLDEFTNKNQTVLQDPAQYQQLMTQVNRIEGMMPTANDQQVLELAMELSGLNAPPPEPTAMPPQGPPAMQQPPAMPVPSNAYAPQGQPSPYQSQQPEPQSFMQAAMQQQPSVNQAGYGTVEPPNNITQSELDTTFVSAFKQRPNG